MSIPEGSPDFVSILDAQLTSDFKSNSLALQIAAIQITAIQPAPKYHTKGCSHSSADNPGVRTLAFAAFEPFVVVNFGVNSANTLLCDALALSQQFQLRFLPSFPKLQRRFRLRAAISNRCNLKSGGGGVVRERRKTL